MTHSAGLAMDADVLEPMPLEARPRQAVSADVEALHRGLMDELDPTRRGHIHIELGRIALKDGRLEAAARHFREALTLDPRLEHARAWLEQLGERVERERPRGLKGLLERVSLLRRR